MIDAIFNRTSQTIEKAMALRMARHNLLASNIANAETPNYRAVDIDFKATMAKWVRRAEEARRAERPGLELGRTDSRHFSLEELPLMEGKDPEGSGIVFAAGDDESVGNDNNSVSLEVQMARMQSNTAAYTVLAQLMGARMGSISQMLDRVSRD